MDGEGTYFESIVFEGEVITVKRFGDRGEPYNPILSADWRSAHPLSKREMERLHVYVREHWDKGERPPSQGARLETDIDW
jgi:hypothetical protein